MDTNKTTMDIIKGAQTTALLSDSYWATRSRGEYGETDYRLFRGTTPPLWDEEEREWTGTPSCQIEDAGCTPYGGDSDLATAIWMQLEEMGWDGDPVRISLRATIAMPDQWTTRHVTGAARVVC